MLRPASVIDPRVIRDALALSYERMGRLLDVSGRTVERMEAFDRPPRSAAVAHRLGQLAQVVDLGQAVYTPRGWRLFLTLPQPRFEGRTALQLLERGETERVIGALATDYEGAPTQPLVVAASLHPWRGTAIRHIPAGSRFDVLDTRFAGLAADNRWNEVGEPTLYLAGDLGVALAEYARHLREDIGITGTPSVHERAVYRVDVQLEALLDLRDPKVRSTIGLQGGARRFLDRGVARATAHFLRLTTSAEGLQVPSVAFLDDPSRWNVVLFLDKLPTDVTTYMSATFYRTVRVAP